MEVRGCAVWRDAHKRVLSREAGGTTCPIIISTGLYCRFLSVSLISVSHILSHILKVMPHCDDTPQGEGGSVEAFGLRSVL